ncbi:MAG: threonine/serine exporter family protein [Clostridia bacterium]|nr:threonine/serine exporter family protein [Clostridia bacterium]
MTIPHEIVEIITGFIGTCGFAVLFNVRGKQFLFSALGGLFSWTLFVIFSQFIPGEVVNYFLVSFLMSIYAEVMARKLKSPASAFATLSLIPLIPGGSLYYTMAYAFEADFDRFLDKAVYTLQLAAALALGVIVATVLTRMILEWLQKLRAVKR